MPDWPGPTLLSHAAVPIPLGLAADADALSNAADAGLGLFRIVCLLSIGGFKMATHSSYQSHHVRIAAHCAHSFAEKVRKSGLLLSCGRAPAARPAEQREQRRVNQRVVHSCPDSRHQDHHCRSVPRSEARLHLSKNSLEIAMEDNNGFASYSVEPTPSPTPMDAAATLTLAPTYDENFSTPYPTYDQGDQGYYDDDDDMTPLMRAYATIGFIIRIFLPIILIVMCCRLKRRGEFADGLGGVGGGGRAQDGGFVSGEIRMDPEERKRYVEERLCSKVRFGSDFPGMARYITSILLLYATTHYVLSLLLSKNRK